MELMEQCEAALNWDVVLKYEMDWMLTCQSSNINSVIFIMVYSLVHGGGKRGLIRILLLQFI